MSKVLNLSFYHFFSLPNPRELQPELRKLGESLELKGTILLGTEGINANLAGKPEAIAKFKTALNDLVPGLTEKHWKFSESDFVPFQRMLVKVKTEIVTMGVAELDPIANPAPHLAPEDLQRWIEEGRDLFLVDTRNDYEFALGSFEGAEQLNIENFRQFPEYVDELRKRQNGRPMVLFCTGGIRCEKAAPLLQQSGFTDIFQLENGILGYFEKCGGENYRGECFVFDERIAVDPALRVTGSFLCQSCQWPLTAGSVKCHHCQAAV